MLYRLLSFLLFFIFFLEIFLVQYLPNLSESTSIPLTRRIIQVPAGHHMPPVPDRRKTAPEIRKYVSHVFKDVLSIDHDILPIEDRFFISFDDLSSLSFFVYQQKGFLWDKRIDIKKTSVKLLHTPYKTV